MFLEYFSTPSAVNVIKISVKNFSQLSYFSHSTYSGDVYKRQEDTQNGDVVEDYEAEGQHDGLTIQNAMLAVYNYLQENNALQNMAFSYTANAKGEVYGLSLIHIYQPYTHF